jgi:NTP pyrophosphatase (non-canonical NTP hydrolase)
MKDIQEQVRLFCLSHNMLASTESRLLDLASELGEVSKAVLKSTEYGKVPFEGSDNFAEELGDLQFALMQLANTNNIDLEAQLKNVMKKYEKRIKQKGDASSGR